MCVHDTPAAAAAPAATVREVRSSLQLSAWCSLALVASGACGRAAEPSRAGAAPVIATQADDEEGRVARAQWRAAPPSEVTAEYEVQWDERAAELTVQVRLTAAAGGRFAMEPGTRPYVLALEAAPEAEPSRWQPVPAPTEQGSRGESWLEVAPCERGACRLRYRVALGRAAEALDDVSWAGWYRGLLVAPPSTWLVAPAPRRAAWAQRLRFAVHTGRGQGFATGLPRDDQGRWLVELRDLWTAPYAVFGELATYQLTVPGAQPVSLALAISKGRAALSHEELARWVTRAAGAVARYWGSFPMRDALVVLAIAPGQGVGGGKTLAGGGGAVLLGVGSSATAESLQRDWVLVHELVHLGFPSLPRHQLWAEEGLATYVEPLIRAGAGMLDEREAWRSLVEGMPNGILAPHQRGLDGTRTWGATYWGGALFWLLGELELRRLTRDRRGLAHALREVAAAPGGNNGTRWPLADVLALADRAAGAPALVPLYGAMKDRPAQVSLDELWRSLGVVVEGGEVRLEDDAPLAATRRALVHGVE